MQILVALLVLVLWHDTVFNVDRKDKSEVRYVQKILSVPLLLLFGKFFRYRIIRISRVAVVFA